jgi:hypothetical protein
MVHLARFVTGRLAPTSARVFSTQNSRVRECQEQGFVAPCCGLTQQTLRKSRGHSPCSRSMTVGCTAVPMLPRHLKGCRTRQLRSTWDNFNWALLCSRRLCYVLEQSLLNGCAALSGPLVGLTQRFCLHVIHSLTHYPYKPSKLRLSNSGKHSDVTPISCSLRVGSKLQLGLPLEIIHCTKPPEAQRSKR